MIENQSQYMQLFSNAQHNAKRRGIDFTVNAEQFIKIAESQNGICAVTGIEFNFRTAIDAKKRPFYPSIDRIDSSKGYSKNNIRIVLTIVNYAMNEWGEGPLIELVEMMNIAKQKQAAKEKEEKDFMETLRQKSQAINTERYMSREEAADYINSLGLPITKGTLQKYATTGGGPVYRRFGKRAVYMVSDVNDWAIKKVSSPMASTSCQ